MRLLRFETAAKRDPAIEAWFESRASELRTLARPWYERMRQCGDDVRELLRAHLADPAGLLEGTGKNMRHVKLRPGSEIDRQALAGLIQAAYWLVQSPAEDR